MPSRRFHWAWLSVLGLSLGAAAPAGAQSPDADPRVTRLVASVSEARLVELLKRLASFETRHTLSAPDNSQRGVGAARQWILEEMQRSSPHLQAGFDSYQLPQQGERITRDTELRNIVAVLPGRSPRRLYVTAHYDTLARAAAPTGAAGATGAFDWSVTDNPAPGVNDDGSGTALVMELARVFGESGMEFDATLVFAVFAGEEQGLVGAKLHAQKAAAAKLPIEGVLNNDMVGAANGGNGVTDTASVRVFSEGPEDSPSRQIARAVRRIGAVYLPSQEVRLMARHDRFGRGGDHTAFNQHGFPGVRVTESKENFARQHTVEDTLDGVSPAYVARNARLNAATLAVLGLAPQAPALTDERGRPLLDRGPSGYDARLRWKVSPGAVAYRVFWREAWTPDWQHEQTVGSGTELLLPDVCIDDFIFGVAAVGSGGLESLVSAYVNPSRPVVEIKTR